MSRFANGRLLRPQGWQGIREPFDTQVAVAIGLTLSTSRARGCLQNEIRPGAAPYSGRPPLTTEDRKSTRLNSSHLVISYAVFCLKKKMSSMVNCVEDHGVAAAYYRQFAD